MKLYSHRLDSLLPAAADMDILVCGLKVVVRRMAAGKEGRSAK